MDFTSVLESIRASGLATAIRESIYWFPLIEAAHVIGLTLVFGTILIVDLRLLGVASRDQSFRRLSSELLRWTWIAFVLALLTGGLMFITEAVVYAGNLSFQLKMLLLALAGLNMLAFQLLTLKTVDSWDASPSTPGRARLAGALSILFWIGVVVAGRAIGFTTSGSGAEREIEPPPADMNFDDFLSGDPASAPPPPPPPPAG